jgi:hypothetical protein
LKPSAKVIEETESGDEFAFGDAHLGQLWLDHCTFLASKVSGMGRPRKPPSRSQEARTSLVSALALLGPLL